MLDGSEDWPQGSGPSGNPGPHPGFPAGSAQPPKRRSRWIIPVAAGLAAILVVAVVVGVAVNSSGGAGAPGTSTPGGTMPPMMFPNALFSQLTQDIQAKNEARFLSVVAPSARRAVQMWWANQQAIGFTTGVIIPDSYGDEVSVDSNGDGTITVLAGTHNSLDPVEDGGQPDVPSARYQIGLHFSGPAAIGEITSWNPLSNTPWDQGTQLYVRKSAHVVVAGDPGDTALVNQTLPLAEAAAEYDIKLVRHVNSHDLHQSGFVVFVSSDAASRDSWFRSGPQPSGWSGDAFGGLTYPLPGASGDRIGSAANVSDSAVGGARVIVVPYQDANESAHQETAVLVHEFIHDILAPDDTGFYSSRNAVPAWANEGIAVAVESLYRNNPDPVPAVYSLRVLTNAIRSVPPSYRTGNLPTTRQIYHESLAVGNDWYTIAGSVYEYIGVTHGIGQMFASAVLLYTNNTTPFGNVLESGASTGNYVFYAPRVVQEGWQAWLATE